MNWFCDTNTIVAAMESSHPHYPRANPLLEAIVRGEHRGFVAAHSLAEIYASLTRLPLQIKVHPQDAKRMIEVNVLNYFQIVQAVQDDYLKAIARMAELGLPGAMIYDALVLQTAARSGVDRIYTFNVKDFKALATPDIAAKICVP